MLSRGSVVGLLPVLPVLAGGCGPAREDTAPIPTSGNVVEIEHTADGEENFADAWAAWGGRTPSSSATATSSPRGHEGCVDGHCCPGQDGSEVAAELRQRVAGLRY